MHRPLHTKITTLHTVSSKKHENWKTTWEILTGIDVMLLELYNALKPVSPQHSYCEVVFSSALLPWSGGSMKRCVLPKLGSLAFYLLQQLQVERI